MMPEPSARRLPCEQHRTTAPEIGRSGASNVWPSVPLLSIASDLDRHFGDVPSPEAWRLCERRPTGAGESA
jgi:hypothetical protein